MTEMLSFHFEGALADEHRMNFYEAARFQYAAARLMVKLVQFRRNGKFTQKVTTASNIDIQLTAQSEGSFYINISIPEQEPQNRDFIQAKSGTLLSYISERVIEKIDQQDLIGANDTRIADPARTPRPFDLDDLVNNALAGEAVMAELPAPVRDVVKRRLAEAYRERQLSENTAAISRIDFARSQKLIAMSAPLLSEMATALRQSAQSMEIISTTGGRSNSVLYLNRKMASDIETAVVDREITPILGDITQFNKDNGWGKLKINNGFNVLNFSIPSDILQTIKHDLMDYMQRDQVYLQAYFVRNAGGEVIRLIVVGILPLPEP